MSSPRFGKLLLMPGLAAGWGTWVRGGCIGAVAVVLGGCGEHRAAGVAGPRWSADSATVQLAAGPQYARSAAWKFFFGTHYRSVWATPVTVPVLRLATAVPGGLVPMQAGGSYQSHTLRLHAPNGREYVLRSVDKDMSAALSPGWKRNLLRGLLKDQTSATQPFGAYPAAFLAEAAGVLHANPRLVFVGPDPGLGKFSAAYANALYLFEERPDGDQRPVASFGHAPQVVNSRHMLAALRRWPSAHVPARAFLRARLLDVLVGDWSRREDQWRWAMFPQAGRVAFRPVPRDRDQAFFLFDDGLVTRLVSWFAPKYQTFRATIRLENVDGLTSTARALDRTLLTSLSANDFREVADSVRASLSDAVLARAFNSGPAETQARLAAKFVPMLRARRAQLPAVAQQYYALLNKQAWLIGTDQAERFILSEAGGSLRVQLLAQRPGRPDSLVTDRTFNRKITPELDLYGLGGDDLFELRGALPEGIAVNLYDGDGRNRVITSPGATPGNVVWYTGPGERPTSHPAGVQVESDPHPELTANGRAWLHRYNLRD
ncbi:DNA polymerase III delta prime subunit [Hymenobacter sp. UYAg731]